MRSINRVKANVKADPAKQASALKTFCVLKSVRFPVAAVAPLSSFMDC